jgi:hypothetical protein
MQYLTITLALIASSVSLGSAFPIDASNNGINNISARDIIDDTITRELVARGKEKGFTTDITVSVPNDFIFK